MTGSEPARSSASQVRLPETVDALVVPLDGSDFSRVAVPIAARLASRLGAEIHLLSAVESVDEVERREQELARVDIPGHAVNRTVMVDRDPAGAIHETLRKLENAVACMATHGRARSAALVGSVATDVVARGHDPLVLVCPYMEQPRRSAGVVACVDDSPAAAPLVASAVRWAELLGERCVVLTVAEDAPEPVSGGPIRRRFGPDGDAEGFLAALVEPFRAAGQAVDAIVRYDPVSVWGGLYRYLLDHPAALVVANTRSWTGLRRLRQRRRDHRPAQPVTRASRAPGRSRRPVVSADASVVACPNCGARARGHGLRRFPAPSRSRRCPASWNVSWSA
jgi:nucleotide-binding universal stress UspA family protein